MFVCCGWRRTCRLYISGSQPEMMKRSHFGSSADHAMEIYVQLEVSFGFMDLMNSTKGLFRFGYMYILRSEIEYMIMYYV